LERGDEPEPLLELAVDVLIALHRHPRAIPAGWRAYDVETMLADLEVYLEWCAPEVGEVGRREFTEAWREVLPLAHRVPSSLLLRDYHVANLLLLPERNGHRRAGLLDFQDAYQGPVTYDLVSLLEDARRDIPDEQRLGLARRYRAAFPNLDGETFDTSMALLAALRHVRVLGIFERLSRRDHKRLYKDQHSQRIKRRLSHALEHAAAARLNRWFGRYGRPD
jgi:aminoglycoside/choline kinase family phosphotransferase